MFPTPLSRVIFVLVGISLGAVVTPETLKGFARFPLSVAVLAVSSVAMIAATSAYLRIVHGWDALSALFGASPGALAQVMVLSAEYKADMRAIAIVQTLRVVALTVGIPSRARAVRAHRAGGIMARLGSTHPESLVELAILLVVSTVSGVVVWRLRLPGGLHVRGNARVRDPARRRLYLGGAAVVGGDGRGDRHRRDHRLAFRQHLAADAAPLPGRGGRLVHGVDERSRRCRCWC